MRLSWLTARMVGLVTASCATSTYEVTTTVVSEEFTQDIWVTGPDDVDVAGTRFDVALQSPKTGLIAVHITQAWAPDRSVRCVEVLDHGPLTRNGRADVKQCTPARTHPLDATVSMAARTTAR